MDASDPSLLAFATAQSDSKGAGSKLGETLSDLIVATSRCPFRAADGTLLNIECFGPPDSSSVEESSPNGGAEDWPLLLYVHGVCESAETWAVQILARHCAEHRWRLFALELDGHGLSGGTRGLCGSFDSLVGHIGEFVEKVCTEYAKTKGFALAGSSMGGALVAYAAQDIMNNTKYHTSNNPQHQRNEHQQCSNFYGVAMLAPAVGIDPRAIPPMPVVTMLRAMSSVVPSWGLLTPVEDPTHYACPLSSTRNFSGRWPLATAAMLLDLTSERVPNDLASARLQLEGVPSLLVVAGARDEIIPLDSVQSFFDTVNPVEKYLMIVKGAGHSFVHYPKSKYIEKLFGWLEECRAKAD